MSSRGLQVEINALLRRVIAFSSCADSAWAPVHSYRWLAACHILFQSSNSTTPYAHEERQ